MRRFELGMCMNYVSHWGKPEAVREFFQNARDESVEHPENEMLFDYSEEDQRITIANKNSVLEFNTLLLGKSSKTGNANLTGEYGEGYKVATVVLLRNNCNVTIYNNKAGEIWEAKKVNSRRYNEEIAVFDISKSTSWFRPKKSKEDMNLVITIDGITPEDFEIIKKNTLLIRDIGKHYENPVMGYGKILLEPCEAGRIYVNGLYVCDEPNLRFGYDFHSSDLSLGRDRDIARQVDMLNACSYLAIKVAPSKFIADNLDCKDFKYTTEFSFTYQDSSEKKVEVKDIVTEKFIAENGDTAIPVKSIETFNKLNAEGTHAILVPNAVYEFIDQDKLTTSEEDISLQNRFEMWCENHFCCVLTTSVLDELRELWEEALNS